MSNKNILHGIFLVGTLFCNYWQSAFVAKLLHSHHLFYSNSIFVGYLVQVDDVENHQLVT